MGKLVRQGASGTQASPIDERGVLGLVSIARVSGSIIGIFFRIIVVRVVIGGGDVVVIVVVGGVTVVAWSRGWDGDVLKIEPRFWSTTSHATYRCPAASGGGDSIDVGDGVCMCLSETRMGWNGDGGWDRILNRDWRAIGTRGGDSTLKSLEVVLLVIEGCRALGNLTEKTEQEEKEKRKERNVRRPSLPGG